MRTLLRIATAIAVGSVSLLIGAPPSHAQAGIGPWLLQQTPDVGQNWESLAYGNGVFVAVAGGHPDNPPAQLVMRSVDGVNWTAHSAIQNSWRAVTYGEGLFVAVAQPQYSGADAPLVMTSPDGITWTGRSAPSGVWQAVTYGNGLFVAGGVLGGANTLMTSPDGITWTPRTGPTSPHALAYGNGQFVGLTPNALYGAATSPDGITWTMHEVPQSNIWNSLAFGNGLFVGVAYSGYGPDLVMTSPDGITWTSRSTPGGMSTQWRSVAYGSGLFVAVGGQQTPGGTSPVVMTSPDGSNWIPTDAPNGFWVSVVHAKNGFVAVGPWGGEARHQVMISGDVAGQASSPIANKCPRAIFIGARGSGQVGGASDGNTGMGGQVYGVWRQVQRSLGANRVSYLNVPKPPYTARAVAVVFTDPPGYFIGMKGGVEWVLAELRARQSACGSERIILSGYSQGAMVMHRVLQSLAGSSIESDRWILDRIDGAVLVADGDRVPGEATRNYGSAGRGTGVGYKMRAISGARGSRLPDSLLSRVHSLCQKNDVVCDFRPAFHASAAGAIGARIHTDSYSDTGDIRLAASRVALRALERIR